MKIFFILSLSIFILILNIKCNSDFKNDSIGRTYEFKCNDLSSVCEECDSHWFIKIESGNSATIFSSPNTNSILKSCQIQIAYVFINKTGTIKIESVNNQNINNFCIDNFIGDWTFNRSGKLGIGFYKNEQCGFVR